MAPPALSDVIESSRQQRSANRAPGGSSPERSRRRPPRTTPKKKWRDDRSRGSGSADSGSAPSSVHLVGGTPLTRELSDLSGSYAAPRHPRRDTTQPVSRDVYPSDQSVSSHHRPWALAKILSTTCEPRAPQPPCMDCDDSITQGGVVARKPTVLMEQSDEVEVITPTRPNRDRRRDRCDEDGQSSVQHAHQLPAPVRTPLLVLLMDPQRKMYELMQLWVDRDEDIVRDVLHTVQQSLSDKENWKQDYDGLFQVRNNHFSQLIHILNLSKYDIQPHELLVAKPWSMSAKATVGYAMGLIGYLKGLDVLQYYSCADHNTRWNFSKPLNDDSILALTKKAKARMYVPGGVLKHHHAYQFLSFSPPFEPRVRVDVMINNDLDSIVDDDGCSCSQISDSQGGMSDSLGGGSVDSSRMSFTDLIASRRASSPPKSLRSSRFPDISTSRIDEEVADPPILVIKTAAVSASNNEPRNVRPRNLTRILSVLACNSCKNEPSAIALVDKEDSNRFETADDTVLTSTDAPGSPVWQVNWEDEDLNKVTFSGADSSIVSESKRPLLIARVPRHPDWIAEC